MTASRDAGVRLFHNFRCLVVQCFASDWLNQHYPTRAKLPAPHPDRARHIAALYPALSGQRTTAHKRRDRSPSRQAPPFAARRGWGAMSIGRKGWILLSGGTPADRRTRAKAAKIVGFAAGVGCALYLALTFQPTSANKWKDLNTTTQTAKWHRLSRRRCQWSR